MNNTNELLPRRSRPVKAARRALGILVLLGCALSLVWAQSGKAPEEKKLNELYSSTAFARAAGASGTFGLSVYIDAYSSDDEIAQLAQTLRDKGSDELLNVVSKLNSKGRLSPTGRVGTDVKVIRVRQTEKGRRIFLVTDRPISFVELYNGTRSRDYEFGVVQLDLDEKGNGEGAMLVATKIRFDKDNQIELEHYGIDPVRLANVRKEK